MFEILGEVFLFFYDLLGDMLSLFGTFFEVCKIFENATPPMQKTYLFSFFVVFLCVCVGGGGGSAFSLFWHTFWMRIRSSYFLTVFITCCCLEEPKGLPKSITNR